MCLQKQMRLQRLFARGLALSTACILLAASPASAQTFESYRCADGTAFIVGFYPADSRAFVQIDGQPVTLKRRLTLFGVRYSGGGISLMIGKTGTTIRHMRRPVTSCELK